MQGAVMLAQVMHVEPNDKNPDDIQVDWQG